MARIHKDKIPTSRPKNAPANEGKAKGKQKQNNGSVLDVEMVTGAEEVDPTLVGDVQAFLKQLNGGDTTGGRQSEKKGKEHKKKSENDKGRKQTEEKRNETAAKEKMNQKSEERGKGKGKNKQSKGLDEGKADIKKDAASAPITTNPTVSAESTDSVAAPKKTASMSKSKDTLLIPPTPLWHTSVPTLPLLPASQPKTLKPDELAALHTRATSLLEADAARYEGASLGVGGTTGPKDKEDTKGARGSADAHFLRTVLRAGTLADRLGALTLLVQASPAHNVRALEGLGALMHVGRAAEGKAKGGGGRSEGLKAARCIVDWWVGTGGPGRKLRYFREQPLAHPERTDAHLALWAFEDWLKKFFFGVLGALEVYSLDSLPYVRTQALSFITTLLREQPEQEQNLLRLLVNKLGDTERSVSSRASYHLLQVLQAHPAMKGVIVREVRALIFRPVASSAAASSASSAPKQSTHIRFGDDEPAKDKNKRKSKEKEKEKRWNSHAWYYAAVTLNQVMLTQTDADKTVARTLIGVYFEMFQEVLGGRAGAHGAADDGEGGEKEEKGKGKGKVKGKGKGKGKGEDAKEVKGEAGFTEVEDTRSRLLSAVLTGVNRALPFAKMDMASDEVFKAHIDTLFLITHKSTFNISLQALLLILQITTLLAKQPAAQASSSSSPGDSFASALTDRFYRTLYASLVDARLATSNKQAMYLNLIFKAMKADRNLERVKAFVRRFVQVLAVGAAGAGGAEFVSGGLYLLGELFQTMPALRSLLGENKGAARHAEPKEGEEYDSRKRDPQYAHASASPMYELIPLLNHFHPAISLHARQLLTGTSITSAPDLALNTLAHFLDRFVYKNPKKPRTRGPSAMQPAASVADGTGVKMTHGEVTEDGARVNEDSFWKRNIENVPVDQLFFHKYFTRKKEREEEMAKKVGKRKGKADGENEEEEEEEEDSDGEVAASADEVDAEEKEDADVASDQEEDSDKEEAEIWKAMKATMPSELQDDDLMEDSDEDDDIPSDLDDDDDEDEQDEDAQSQFGGEDEDDDEDAAGDDDAFSLVEGSDAEDLLPLDAEVPGLIEYDGSDASDEEEEWGGISGSKATKGKRKRDEEGEKGRRKKLRSLPTFATYDEYARMIEDAPEDNI